MQSIPMALDKIRAKAAELREAFGDEIRARTLEWAAGVIEAAIRQEQDQHLTLVEASAHSGYSPDHLARLVREGKLPNAGRRGAPRIRAGDLPVRARSDRVTPSTRTPYDLAADAEILRVAKRL